MEKQCERCGAVFETNRSARRFCPGYRCSNAVTALRREDAKRGSEPVIVWSCGGGVQSTAIALLIVKGRLPKPDYALITDVGYEKAATFEYVHAVLQPRLAEVGVDLQEIRTTDFVSNSMTDNQGHVRIPAYARGAAGEVIKYKTHCSGEWKMRVARQWLRKQGVRSAINWIGISSDEVRRVKPSGVKWLELRYPLVELGIRREDCLWLIAQAGWPRPPRTSCYLCPHQDDMSWLRTKRDYPEDWQAAVKAEDAIREEHPDVYFHKSLIPLREVEFKGISLDDMLKECDTPGVQCWG